MHHGCYDHRWANPPWHRCLKIQRIHIANVRTDDGMSRVVTSGATMMNTRAINPWTISISVHLLLLVAMSALRCRNIHATDVQQARDVKQPDVTCTPVDAVDQPRVTEAVPRVVSWSDTDEVVPIHASDSRNSVPAVGLQVHLSADRNWIKLGETVQFAIELENTTDQEISLCVGYTWHPQDAYVENYFQNGSVLELDDDPQKQLARFVLPYQPECVKLSPGDVLRYQTAATVYGEAEPATQDAYRLKRPGAHVAYGLPRYPTFVQFLSGSHSAELRFVVRYHLPPLRETLPPKVWDRALVSNVVPITVAR